MLTDLMDIETLSNTLQNTAKVLKDALFTHKTRTSLNSFPHPQYRV